MESTGRVQTPLAGEDARPMQTEKCFFGLQPCEIRGARERCGTSRKRANSQCSWSCTNDGNCQDWRLTCYRELDVRPGVSWDIPKRSGEMEEVLDLDLTEKLQMQHDCKRLLHEAPKLAVDKTLKSEAQTVAEKCEVNAKKTQYANTPGENRYFSFGPEKRLVSEVMHGWYDLARSYYDPNHAHEDGKTWTYSHPFTQVVWKSTPWLCAGQVHPSDWEKRAEEHQDAN